MGRPQHLLAADLSHQDRKSLNVADLEEFTESLAAIIVHLKRDKGYDCVKGISFFNEPEQMTDYHDTLASVYRSLGAQLRRHGVRDDAAIQAFDGAIFWTSEEGYVADGVSRLLGMADADIDIISLHDYHSIFEYQKGAQIDQAYGTILDYTIGKKLRSAPPSSRSARQTQTVRSSPSWSASSGRSRSRRAIPRSTVTTTPGTSSGCTVP